MEQIVWLVLLIVSLVVEVLTMGLTAIWFAGGASVSLLVSFLNGPIWLQIFLFVVTSLVLLYFTRPIAMKYFNKNRVKTNVDSIIGEKAIVTLQIDNIRGEGKATVGGQEWSARSVSDDVIIPVGAIVVVDEINGVKLVVKPEKETM